MPRRGNELESASTLPKKKTKMIEECSSLDVSFFDDEALPPGIVFTDVQLKKWRIGKPIGNITIFTSIIFDNFNFSLGNFIVQLQQLKSCLKYLH